MIWHLHILFLVRCSSLLQCDPKDVYYTLPLIVQLQYMIRSLEEMMCMALWLDDDKQKHARQQFQDFGTEFTDWDGLDEDERFAIWTSFGFTESRHEVTGGVSKFHGSLLQSIITHCFIQRCTKCMLLMAGYLSLLSSP